ncbi:hypothetical protein CC86DRAFT_19844 [Ophiobolus disseminans]|uniref:Uncharacterized protein n=1 Tax=Ophiobolus disseminans TaxID=1469910 RepID=A0A6A7A1S7_9PLEO|nr:hypothetical protein CC86DRAFT_19844 [Ophiobolus disseminans]
MSYKKKVKVIAALDISVIILVVTSLRLKALQLAVSTDFTYSKSYLSLLSAAGCLLSIVLCGAIAIYRILIDAKIRMSRDIQIPVPVHRRIYNQTFITLGSLGWSRRGGQLLSESVRTEQTDTYG